MGKKDSLKDQLLKAAKRRAQRVARMQESGSEGSSSLEQTKSGTAVGGGKGVVATPEDSSRSVLVTGALGASKSLVANVDQLARVILAFDNSHDGLTDRQVIAALRGMLRGYPTNDLLVRDLYSAIQKAKSEFEGSARVVRAAIEQMLETFQACGDGSNSNRDALVYLRSVAS